jgi:hypothetical protein
MTQFMDFVRPIFKITKLNTFKEWLFPSSGKNVGREIYYFVPVRAVPI